MSSKSRTSDVKKALFTFLSALACIAVGLLVGFLLLFAISPESAPHGFFAIIGNFMYFPKAVTQMKYLGLTLAKTAPLVMCALSVIYANKVGLFNIGVAGQYVAGVCGSLFLALACGLPWLACVVAAALFGALLGAVCGGLKVFRNVNEVISGILLNWIILYFTNMALTTVKAAGNPYTLTLDSTNPGAIMPALGLDVVFGTPYAGMAIIIAVVAAILVWCRFKFTRFGFELKSIGSNKYAARSMGMKEKMLTVAAMAIAGALAGLGGSMLFLSGYEEWMCSTSSVPAMGFNGLAAGFLGGLNPIGAIFSSFFIQHITDGGTYLDTSVYSKETSSLIAAVIIYLCGFMMMLRDWMMKRAKKPDGKDVNAIAAPTVAGNGVVANDVDTEPDTAQSAAEGYKCDAAAGDDDGAPPPCSQSINNPVSADTSKGGAF